jgi:hypothetical protein
MRRLTAEQVAVASVLLLATAAGVISALGVVRPPSALCITPYGTATVAPGCDPGQVSAALGVVAGALTATVTAVFGLAIAGAVLSICQRRRTARGSGAATTTEG